MPAALRPRDVPPRPLAGLAMLLGVRTGGPGRTRWPGRAARRRCPGSRTTRAGCGPVTCTPRCPAASTTARAFCDQAAAAGRRGGAHRPGRQEPGASCGLPVFVVADPRARLGEVASWIYGNPSGRLTLIGVTGTSGKTTTTYLLESGLRAAGHLTGLVGGVQTRIGGVSRRQRADHPGGHRPAGAAGRDGGARA